MILDTIIKILNDKNDLSGWKLLDIQKEVYEVYYIQRELEMNRAKKIHDIELTVYKDFEEDGVKYKGSSITKIHPTMLEDELITSINNAVFAANFAKTPYYPLVQPTKEKFQQPASNFKEETLDTYLALIVEAIYKADAYEKGCINSTEIFLSKINKRLINSLGIDYCSMKYEGEVEFITNWKEEKEEIELYRHLEFGDFNSETLTKEVEDMLEKSRGRAIATSTPPLGKHNVILNNESVRQMMEYYYLQTGASYIYEKYSTAEINENLQGKEITGDKLTLMLVPYLKGSTYNELFDEDGIILEKVTIIENGIFKNGWGNRRYSYYIDINPTGNLRNLQILGGKKSILEFKEKPYLEIVSFSNFQLDDFTGDFGGEIRLAWYFDGQKTVPVTGGTICGKIQDIQGDMYLSSEMISLNRYYGPRYLLMKDVIVTGNE